MSDSDTGKLYVGMNVSDLRRSAVQRKLKRKDLKDEPFQQFEEWFELACEVV